MRQQHVVDGFGGLPFQKSELENADIGSELDKLAMPEVFEPKMNERISVNVDQRPPLLSRPAVSSTHQNFFRCCSGIF